jgi:hypothetical protein
MILPGLQALLDALRVSIVDDTVNVPLDLGLDPGRIHVAGIGWATVELDRAAAELGAELDTTFEPAARDALLGAAVRSSTGKQPRFVLLEPDTEGRLSGALARHAEGPVALYLRVPSLEQLPGTLALRAGRGPLGPARLVLAGDPWGPFLIFVETAPPAAPDRVPSEP